ncbi:MAG TPA: tRNA (adenosine(37)-N6)-threonylcarbamoyltransferase complex ATPase subunit type 1 TsaE [Acidimicrobiales bacterium]|nr:tRNA (adenosine(37)-N6)-threonylcarbamoyltransferase complex ATPase subunit type 1 TsaE [Acidimicrobiales bacterium]
MITAFTKSADDTRELGASLASLVVAGDVVLLSGDLGAGKTTFTQGFGRGLGVRDEIVSPTFTLVRSYEGRLPLVHCDVYRLDHLQEVIDLGLGEMIDDGAVALVEWGDVAAPGLPGDHLETRIEFTESDDERWFEFRPAGSSWLGRTDRLRAATERWQS